MYSVVIEYINNGFPLTINRIDTDNISFNKNIDLMKVLSLIKLN